MTDQTRTTQSAAKPSNTSNPLSVEDQTKLETLTAPRSERYRADAQNQHALERLRAWMRALFKREDHRRWRDSKTKILGFLVVGAAAFAFWNYYPRPQFSAAENAPGLSITSSTSALPQEASVIALPSNLSGQKPDPLEAVPPPTLPTARITANPSGLTTPATPSASNAPSSETYQNELYQSEPISPPMSQSRVLVQQPMSDPGFGTGLGSNVARLPALGQPVRLRSKNARVAPAPTPLVQRPAISSRLPKPLVDRDGANRQQDESPVANPEPNATPIVVPFVVTSQPRADESQAFVAPSADANGTSFGQAGALVDVTQARESAPNIPTQPGGLVDGAGRASNTSSTSGTVSNQNPTLPESAYPPGTRANAKLVVGLIAVQGQDSPVVAQLEGGAFAFGKANLNQGGRIQISLLEIVQAGVSSSVNGSMLGADGFPGMAVELREDSPDVVGKLWQAGLQGVSNYAQSAIQGATTTIANGATSVTGPQPDLGLSLLQGLAQAFLAPQGQPSVKYAKLEPGTPYEILFLPAR